MGNLITRILHSKKAVYVAIPVFANLVAEVFGFDVTNVAMLMVDLGFAGLAVSQLALDLRWGSASDGTGQAS